MKPLHLTFIISTLGMGGAERVLSNMANYWVAKGWPISIITFDDASRPPFYPLDHHILRIPLDALKKKGFFFVRVTDMFTRLWKLRKAILKDDPDVVISFIDVTNIFTLLATRGLHMPVIISERTDPSKHQIGYFRDLFRKLCYPWADCIVVQTRWVYSYFESWLGERVRIIPNPVLPPPRSKDDNFDMPLPPYIVAMGRLSHEKGYDLLIDAFSHLVTQYPSWKLVILGEGPLHSELVQLIHQYGLEKSISLLGQVKNPYPFLLNAEMFVLPSRYEGFPNALCEAMACGLPAVITNCSPGISDIARDQVDCLVVPAENVQDLTSAMEELIGNDKKRKQLGARAGEITARFGLDEIMKSWEDILDEL